MSMATVKKDRDIHGVEAVVAGHICLDIKPFPDGLLRRIHGGWKRRYVAVPLDGGWTTEGTGLYIGPNDAARAPSSFTPEQFAGQKTVVLSAGRVSPSATASQT